ncbi:MAG: hypothetical protein DRI57_20635 [Deltaproteobacteria bacterium]|nr:MAG: hypothetical protein DRI57_20635 [Deltaproteobacteria bacterium]
MPYKTIWEEKGVFWQYSGNVTGEELFQTALDLYEDQRFDDIRYLLVDFYDIKQYDGSAKLVEKIAAMNMGAAYTNPRVKVAIVAVKDQIRSLANLYASISRTSPWKTRIFDNLSDARLWTSSA